MFVHFGHEPLAQEIRQLLLTFPTLNNLPFYHVETLKGLHKKLVMVGSYMVLLAASWHVFLLSLDKNDSMDCCNFIMSGERSTNR